MPRFVIRGKEYNLSMEDVINSMKGVEPEPIRRHYVKIDGKEYPIKQVVAGTLRIARISFTSMDAYRILTKLGFSVYEKT
jgi:hypothetical protein